MKVLVCFGTRPEAIKMAPIIRELQGQRVTFKVCITAQHREMLDQVMSFFKIKPDYDLNLMKSNQSLNALFADILKETDIILKEELPDIVLVQGDTSTSFAVTMCAFNKRIKVGHIEAGLRTYNLSAPFPEEGNRQLISRLANFHFVPTTTARENLLNEGICEKDIFLTGNTVVDALEAGKALLENGYKNDDITRFNQYLVPFKKLVLVTGHRRENFGKGIEEICQALLQIAERKDVQIIFPVHLNPQVKNMVYKNLSGRSNIFLSEPVDYPTLLWLLDKCNLIISDSGGIQEEAPSFGKPVIVTREVTERTEGIEAGFTYLTGTSQSLIVKKACGLLESRTNHKQLENPYGDGQAAKKIVNILKNNL